MKHNQASTQITNGIVAAVAKFLSVNNVTSPASKDHNPVEVFVIRFTDPLVHNKENEFEFANELAVSMKAIVNDALIAEKEMGLTQSEAESLVRTFAYGEALRVLDKHRPAALKLINQLKEEKQ